MASTHEIWWTFLDLRKSQKQAFFQREADFMNCSQMFVTIYKKKKKKILCRATNKYTHHSRSPLHPHNGKRGISCPGTVEYSIRSKVHLQGLRLCRHARTNCWNKHLSMVHSQSDISCGGTSSLHSVSKYKKKAAKIHNHEMSCFWRDWRAWREWIWKNHSQ